MIVHNRLIVLLNAAQNSSDNFPFYFFLRFDFTVSGGARNFYLRGTIAHGVRGWKSPSVVHGPRPRQRVWLTPGKNLGRPLPPFLSLSLPILSPPFPYIQSP